MIELALRGDFFDLANRLSLNPHSVGDALAKRQWIQYNPNKPIKRYGLPITSKDGSESLDYEINGLTSLKELFGKDVIGKDVEGIFSTLTPLAYELNLDSWFQLLLGEDFQTHLGRCHLIKLDSGGFFPPHRDGNLRLPYQLDCFRLFTPLIHCGPRELVWLQNGKQLNLIPGTTYFINTFQEHSVYSFVDNCIFAVFNIKASGASLVARHLGCT